MIPTPKPSAHTPASSVVTSYTIWCQALNSQAVIYMSERDVNTILLVSFRWIRGYLWMQAWYCFFSLLHLCFPRGQLSDMHILVWQLLLSIHWMQQYLGFVRWIHGKECAIYLDLWKYWWRGTKNHNIYFVSCRAVFSTNFVWKFNEF